MRLKDEIHIRETAANTLKEAMGDGELNAIRLAINLVEELRMKFPELCKV